MKSAIGRSVLKKPRTYGPDNDAAEQQAYDAGICRRREQAGNGDEHRHSEREFRQRRKTEEMVSDEVQGVRAH